VNDVEVALSHEVPGAGSRTGCSKFSYPTETNTLQSGVVAWRLLRGRFQDRGNAGALPSMT
jgi:hypothetical protein